MLRPIRHGIGAATSGRREYIQSVMRWFLYAVACFKLAASAWGEADLGTNSPPPDVRVAFGLCDASGGVSVASNLFLVASDEDNILRLYQMQGSSNAVARFDLRRFVGRQEADLEAGARVGNRAYWLGSHGIGPEGKAQFARRVFFATDLAWDGKSLTVRPVGQVYRHLVEDLLTDRRFDRFDLRRASSRMAKEVHALDIEALAAGADGALLIGFRNPIVNGKALVIPLLNPDGVISGQRGRFGDPIEFDFGGLGLREMVRVKDAYYLLAGSYDSVHNFRFYRWQGPASKAPPEQLPLPSLNHLNPEGLIYMPERPQELLALSDDGNRLIHGTPGKRLKNENQRPFRWFSLNLAP